MSDYLNTPYFSAPDLAEANKLLASAIPQLHKNLGLATVFITILDLHPELSAKWRDRFGFWLLKKVALKYKRAYPKDGVGWNDYHMARWLILGTEEDFEAIYRRYYTPGNHHDSCVWMVDSMRVQCPTFDLKWLSRNPPAGMLS